MRLFLISVFTVALMAACGGTQQNQSAESPNEGIIAAEESDQEQPTVEHPGLVYYKRYCLTCHQVDGGGVPGVYPPLTDKSWLQRPDAELIGIVLNGLEGKIEVAGETYNNAMAPMDYLSDEQIAESLNYIRDKFGGLPSDIQPEDVAAQR